MSNRKTKQIYVKQIIEDRHSACFRATYKLLNVMLEECRFRNDTATLEEVPKIQGEIRIINRLIKLLTPKPKSTSVYDGGFGE